MTSDHQQSGFVEPEKLYTLKAFKQRLGITDSTLRAARRNGFKVQIVHKQGYIYGQDWIDYVRNYHSPLTGDPPTLPSSRSQPGISQGLTSPSEEIHG